MFQQDDFEKLREFVGRDLAYSSIALHQLVKDRKKRVMGALAGEKPEDLKLLLMQARALASYCELFIDIYYLPNFARYHRLRAKAVERGDFAEVRDLDMAVAHFYGPYTFYAKLTEIAYTIFDMAFDQYNTVTAMLGLPEDENKRRGPINIATDKAELERRRRHAHAGEDKARQEGVIDTQDEKADAMPSFEEALDFAKKHKDEIPEPQPIEELGDSSS